MIIELTESQIAALKMLAANQNKNVRSEDELLFAYVHGTILGRAEAKAKTAKDDAAKEYDAANAIAKAMGVVFPVSRTDFVNGKGKEWEKIILALKDDSPSKDAE
jgi:hypothetical protein